MNPVNIINGVAIATGYIAIRWANFYLTHPFLDLVSGRSSSWQTAHVRVGGVV